MRQNLPRSLTLCCAAAALVFAVSGCAPLPPQGNAAPHHAKAQAAHDALHPMARAALAQPALNQPQSAQQRQQWLDRVTWGGMIAEGRTSIHQAWWVIVFPLITLFLTVLSFSQLGEGLKDRFDPVLR